MDAIYSSEDPSMYAEVHVENLAPWQPPVSNQQPGSSLQFVSNQVDAAGPIDFFVEPLAGQTSIRAALAWASVYGGRMPLFEAAAGDKVYINQLGELSAGTLPDGRPLGYSAVVRSVETEALDAYPGGYLPLTGVLEPLAMREVSVDWRLPEYTRHANEVLPGARGVVPVLSISPAAHGLANGWVGYSAELLNLYLPLGASFDFSAPLRFGNPFPSDWGGVAAVSYPFRSLQSVPDGSGRAVYVRGALTSYVSVEELSAGPLVPQMTPPLSLTLDGMPAFTVREVLSTNPVLAWSPPSVGAPSAYQVLVYEYEPDLNQPVFRSSLYVPGSVTQVRLPPDMLDPASIYYLRVSAIAVAARAAISRATIRARAPAVLGGATVEASTASIAPGVGATARVRRSRVATRVRRRASIARRHGGPGVAPLQQLALFLEGDAAAAARERGQPQTHQEPPRGASRHEPPGFTRPSHHGQLLARNGLQWLSDAGAIKSSLVIPDAPPCVQRGLCVNSRAS
ncbi:hypothetical protein [Myxococcus qinghaiensis]|uniref:hypothetical protein n=1 Tax=Myxococcus qinghaiensis TaxID=2906758 RepID=UPI0020A82FB5|nr:hypothetical protein [Myxococcus qinghaiensis]